MFLKVKDVMGLAAELKKIQGAYDLVCTVILLAIEDATFDIKTLPTRTEYQRQRKAAAERLKNTAKVWIFSEEEKMGSLRWYCDLIGFDYKAIQQKVRILNKKRRRPNDNPLQHL